MTYWQQKPYRKHSAHTEKQRMQEQYVAIMQQRGRNSQQARADGHAMMRVNVFQSLFGGAMVSAATPAMSRLKGCDAPVTLLSSTPCALLLCSYCHHLQHRSAKDRDT